MAVKETNSNTSDPEVTIIISIYNGSNFLYDCLMSVLDQDYKKLNLIVIDDKSKDNSADIARDLLHNSKIQLHNYRIILNEKNTGLYRNINTALNLCDSKYIKLMGQDDILEPNCISKWVKEFEANETLMLGWCYERHIDAEGNFTGKDEEGPPQLVVEPSHAIEEMAQWGCLSSNITNLFFRRDLISAVGNFRTDLKSADFEFMSRAQLQFNSLRLAERLVRIRSHKEQWGQSNHDLNNHLLGNIAIFNGLLEQNARMKLVDQERLKHMVCYRLSRRELWWATKAVGRNISLREWLKMFVEAATYLGMLELLLSFFSRGKIQLHRL